MLEELSRNYGTSIVLCTATQPAIVRNDEFEIGLSEPTEIVRNPKDLYRKLRRVNTTYIKEKFDNDALAARLANHPRVLCIVNTRRHARQLFDLMPNDGSRFHLSALMCPEHITCKLKAIQAQLSGDRPVRVISTQLIEAGINIDFPVVFRALAGLDSIAQAAGAATAKANSQQMPRIAPGVSSLSSSPNPCPPASSAAPPQPRVRFSPILLSRPARPRLHRVLLPHPLLETSGCHRSGKDS